MLLIPTTVNEWSYLKISINKICAYESGMMISLSGLRVVAAPSRTCEAISGEPSQALLSAVGVTPASYQDGGLGWGLGVTMGYNLPPRRGSAGPSTCCSAHTPAMCAFIAITKLSVINALANCSMHDQTIK